MNSDNAPSYTMDGFALVEKTIEAHSAELKTLAEQMNQATAQEIRDDFSKRIDELAEQIKGLSEESKKAKAALTPGVEVGSGEQNKFSFHRYLKAVAKAKKDGPSVWDKKEFGYENDYRKEMVKRVDSGVLKTFSGATDASGAYLIGTDVSQTILELLGAQSIGYQAGVTRIDGLTSNMAMVRETGNPTVYWIDTEAEESITESTGSYTNITARPHPMAAISKLTWGMLNQPSVSMEAQIRSQLGRIMARAEDKAIFVGTGLAGEPTGIFNAQGVSTNNLGASSATAFGIEGTSPTIATTTAAMEYFRQFGQTLRSNNAMGLPGSRMAWVMEPEVAEDIEAVPEALVGRPVFLGDQDLLIQNLMRIPVYVSTQLTKATGADQDRRVMLGDMSQVLVPHWGALEVRVDEEGDDFKKARMSVRILQAMDTVVMQPTALVKATNYQD